jgi:hypothetical protein
MKDQLINQGTGMAEQAIDNATGHKFDGAVQQAGQFADQAVEGQGGQGGFNQGQGQSQSGQNQGQNQGQGQSGQQQGGW